MSYPNQHQQQPPLNPYGGAMPMYGGPPPPSGYPPGAPAPNMSPPPPGMLPINGMPYGAPPPLPGYPAAPPQHSTPFASPYASPYPMNPSFHQGYGSPTGPPPPSPYFPGQPGQPGAYPPPQQQMPQHPQYNQQQQQPQQFPNPYAQQVPQQPQYPSMLAPNMYAHNQLPAQQQHPSAASGVQMDPYGLPVVPGDPPAQYGLKLRVEEKIVSATRDSFTVFDQNGSMKYKIDGLLSINERKIMKDLHGNILLKLREARLKMRDKITIFNAHNVALLTLQKASAIQIGSKRVNGYLGNKTTSIPALIITGNSNNTHFRVLNQRNQEVVEITRRKFSFKNMLTDQDTYDVTVNYGSPALACFITVAIDEIYED